MSVRADKLLADNSTLSRKQAAAAIRAGRVTADGTVLRSGDQKLVSETVLTLDGEPLTTRAHLYVMMNKPKGVLSVSDAPGRQTAVDLLPADLRRRGIFPAGRLDLNSTGFLLLTDDGVFAHQLLAPKKHVPKTYRVMLDTPVTKQMQQGFAEGVTLADETLCRPAQLEYRAEDPCVAWVTLHEGRYHQIKRMFGIFGAGVNELHRVRIGDLMLDESLKPGECRLLTPQELELLRNKSVQ